MSKVAQSSGLGPETAARNEAEKLLRQGVDNWQRSGELLSAETFALVDAESGRLRLDAGAQELMLRSALQHGQAVAHWLVHLEDEERALTLAHEALVKPEGEAARQSLSQTPGNVAPERLRALAERLALSWRGARSTESAYASDALWALRSCLPRGLWLHVALSRLPRRLWRVALPLAVVLATALVVVAILWEPRLWMPKPKIEWVRIPAGEFLMGSDPSVDPDASDDELPQHTVYLDAYRIGRYEVTNAQYAQCVRATVCKYLGDISSSFDSTNADHPVVYVSWSEASTFCNWIGGKLPTEAQWEKAARGTDGRIFPWGNDAPTCNRANYGDCSNSSTPVGRYRPAGDSPYGVADMAGNVWEWVADWYNGRYYANSPSRNPTGPSSGVAYVTRGGSWSYDETYIRAANRGFGDSDFRYVFIGFRCGGSG